MRDWFLRMFDSTGFPARWHCGEWSSFLGWLHIVSDVVIWVAYMGIPAVLLYLVRHRRDLPFLPIFLLFILFIASCGIGHLVEAAMFWWPAYRFSGTMKLVTAVASIATLFAMVPFTKRALALPGTAELLTRLRFQSAEAQRNQQALHLTQEQLRLATTASGVGLWEIRADDERGTWDPNTRTMFGLSPTEAVGGRQFLLDFVQTGDRAKIGESLRTCFADGSPLHERCRIVTRAGGLVHVVARGTVLRDDTGKPVAISGAFFNVTEEERARDSMRSSLAEKETLLREIHHRVKNNMQVVSSMLSLQAAGIDDAEHATAFRECQARVRAMAMVHEHFYNANNLAELDFGSYVRELTKMLVRVQGRSEVSIAAHTTPVKLDIQKAIPLGLILNELVTNALKHAFLNGRSGTLHVTMATAVDGSCRLIVADDGPGLPSYFDAGSSQGLGMRIVRSLVRQLDGEFAWETTNGAVFTVTFQLPPERGEPPATG